MGIALPFKRAEVNTLGSSGSFQIAVLNDFPFMPPDLGIFFVIPVNCVHPMAFPVSAGEPDTLAVLVQVINLVALWQPAPLLVHWPEREQQMSMGIAVAFIVIGNIGDHAFGDELLLTILTQKFQMFFSRQLHRQAHDKPAGKLGVPLIFHSLDSVP